MGYIPLSDAMSLPTPQGRLNFRSRYAVPVMVLLGLAASFAVAYEARDNEELRVREDVKRRADTRHILIRDNIQGYVEGLYSLRNLLGVHEEVTSDKFRVVARDAIVRHPGYDGIQWIPNANVAGRPPDTQNSPNASSNGDAKPPALPTSPRDESRYYFSADETLSDADLKKLAGHNYPSGPLAKYFERARVSKRLIVTEQTDILTPTGPAKGVLIIMPVAPLISGMISDYAEGKDACIGFLVGIFRSEVLFGHSWRQFNGPVTDVLFIDATPGVPADKRLLFFWTAVSGNTPITPATEAEFRAGWYRELPLLIGDRVWIFLHRSKEGWFARQRTFVPPTILGGGILLTLFFAAYIRSASRRTELVETEVAARTTELQKIQGMLQEDIQRREDAEALLRASQQQLQGLMENSPNSIYVKDPEGRYVSVNRRYAQLHGRQREEFSGKSDFDLFPPDIAARMRMSDARVLSTGQPVELEDTFAVQGSTHTSIVHKFPLIDDEGTVHGLCGIATDISERKRAEAEIRENRRQLEAILGQLPGMAFRYAHDGQLTPVYISRGALGLTGHSARDFLEKHVSLQDIVHLEDRERARDAVANAVKKRRSYEIEYRIIDRSGKIVWVLDRGQGVYNEDGLLLFVEGLAINITQRKDAESEKLIVERRLLEGQKLESIGVLAGGIAHDFNNLLTGILGNANLASLDLPRTSPIQQNLRQIETASQRAAELCQQMLAYAGKGRFLIQRVELGTLVESTVPLLRASISKRATLKFQLQPALPTIMADPTQMRQIVMNLVINASEALNDEDGTISLSTSLIRPSAGFFEGAVLTPPETAADFVQFEVSDTGTGMDPATLAKIFDPFFTTKFAGRGLGLAAVQGIIRSHRGGLKVRSVPDHGSTFTLLIPASTPAPLEAIAARRATATPWKQTGRALVIDDEDHVLKVTGSLLQSCGLNTELARDGYEGIDLFRAHPADFDIVLLDMTMPRLSGEETLELLREIRPDVRVLFMSGYNRKEVVDTLAGVGPLGFIQKPFTLEALRENLQAMLS